MMFPSDCPLGKGCNSPRKTSLEDEHKKAGQSAAKKFDLKLKPRALSGARTVPRYENVNTMISECE